MLIDNIFSPPFCELQPMHSPLDYFPSTDAANSSKPSVNTHSLNGKWKFQLIDNPSVSIRFFLYFWQLEP